MTSPFDHPTNDSLLHAWDGAHIFLASKHRIRYALLLNQVAMLDDTFPTFSKISTGPIN